MKNNSQKNSKVSVTKEEIGDLWNVVEKSTKELLNLLDRIYKYSSWITNVSIALLGFYLAILLQFKSKGEIPYLINSIFILLFLCSAIIIGFYLRIRYEIIFWYKNFSDGFKNIGKFLDRTIDIFKQKGISVGEKVDLDFAVGKFEEAQKYYPIKLIYIQFMLLSLSIFNITFNLIRYIFFE